MTTPLDPRGVTSVLAPRAAPAPSPARDALAARNRRLNETHAMAAMRARGGWIVRAIEARRRALVVGRVLRGRHARVLDLGAEDGWVAEGYAGHAERVVLADVDPRVLQTARLGPPRVARVVADAADAEGLLEAVGAERFDVVVLSALLEHLPRPSEALEAAARVLAPGGRVVVYLPADGPILFLKRVLAVSRLGSLVRGLSLAPAPGHLHRFTRRRVRRLLTSNGRVSGIAFDPVALGWAAVLVPRRCGAGGRGPGPRAPRRERSA